MIRFLALAVMLGGGFHGNVLHARTPSRYVGRPVICVDPGHPSEINDGMQRQNGTTETHCNWVVAVHLKALLERAGYRVVMTKQHERQRVANVCRARIANDSKARLMVRLHCDTGGGSGFRVFYPDAQGRDGKAVGPPAAVRRSSRVAAEAMHAGLVEALSGRLQDNGVSTDRSTVVGRRKGGALIGSIHARVPVVLVEMVFLNNPSDAAYVKSAAGQESLARGLYQGVERFVPTR